MRLALILVLGLLRCFSFLLLWSTFLECGIPIVVFAMNSVDHLCGLEMSALIGRRRHLVCLASPLSLKGSLPACLLSCTRFKVPGVAVSS